MNWKQPRLIVITGPTAVGKTETSIQVAEILGTEIVSADSRQFYRELSIGTAKPNPRQLARVKHHFINSHSIAELYGAGHFERDALALLDVLFEKHQTVIVTGGSGMYIKALLEGIDAFPDIPIDVRNKIAEEYLQNGREWLQEQVWKVDPDFMSTADQNNVQRLIRALEIARYTGSPISQFRKGYSRQRSFAFQVISLERDRTELYDRIDRRVDHMMDEGLLTEVKGLLPFKNHNALQTVGYKELFAFLEGSYSLEEAILKIKQHTRNYAKRQLTWTRNQLQATVFHPDSLPLIIEHIVSGNGITT
jgi:tRNA dimethylallyltransferase